MFILLPMVAMADDSGSCGTNVTYTYVESTHTLTISGNGYMTNYGSLDNHAPWYSYRSEIANAIIENGVTSIGNRAFYYCSELISVTIPGSVTSIGDRAFQYCSSLTSVNIPNSVTSIGSGAFCACSGLTSIVVEEGNSVYDSRDNCNAIIKTEYDELIVGCQSTIILNGVKSIGRVAFCDCSGLTSVNIPNSVTSIGEYAFRGCSGLSSVTIPNSVTSIGRTAFAVCSGLTSITIPNSVTSIDEQAFAVCSGLTSITIPNSVTSIGGSAFSGCSGLTSVTIPNNVTSIGNYAFQDCSGLTVVNIGDGIKTIGHEAFANCLELTDVTCYAENAPKTTSDAFKDSYIEYVTLHVPAESVSSYNSKAPWSSFGTIVPIVTEVEVTIGAAGMATFCSSKDLDFSEVEGLKAYTGAAFNRNTGALTMLEVKDVPAGTGLIVVGNAGSYDVPGSSGSSCVYANLLKGVSTATNLQQTDGGYTNYILGSGAQGTGFYLVSAGGGTLAAGKAYLQIPTTAANSRSAISMEFVEGTTGVGEATLLMDNGKLTMDNEVFDLQGRRVTMPQKPGIYVKNGRKVVVK